MFFFYYLILILFTTNFPQIVCNSYFQIFYFLIAKLLQELLNFEADGSRAHSLIRFRKAKTIETDGYLCMYETVQIGAV